MKTIEIMQQALINAGLLTEERAERVNRIEKENKRKALRAKRAVQRKQAAQAKARWNRAAA